MKYQLEDVTGETAATDSREVAVSALAECVGDREAANLLIQSAESAPGMKIAGPSFPGFPAASVQVDREAVCDTHGAAYMAHYDDGSSLCGRCYMQRAEDLR